MYIIAHRGNIFGPDKESENKPEYLINAISKKFYVETDLWKIDSELYLGHDNPQYKININFLLDIKEKLFCHCKNIDALFFLLKYHPEIECFYHKSDDCVITSKNHIWNYPGTKLTENSICVMPEIGKQKPVNCLGVCTDFPYHYVQ